jgi:hypothetical protein
MVNMGITRSLHSPTYSAVHVDWQVAKMAEIPAQQVLRVRASSTDCAQNCLSRNSFARTRTEIQSARSLLIINIKCRKKVHNQESNPRPAAGPIITRLTTEPRSHIWQPTIRHEGPMVLSGQAASPKTNQTVPTVHSINNNHNRNCIHHHHSHHHHHHCHHHHCW